MAILPTGTKSGSLLTPRSASYFYSPVKSHSGMGYPSMCRSRLSVATVIFASVSPPAKELLRFLTLKFNSPMKRRENVIPLSFTLMAEKP